MLYFISIISSVISHFVVLVGSYASAMVWPRFFRFLFLTLTTL